MNIGRRCLCCGADSGQKILFPVTFEYGSKHELIDCGSCGTAYFFPQPQTENLRAFYSIHSYEFNPHSQAGRARRLVSDYLRNQRPGKFLDVGCATGFLLHAIRSEVGWEVHGVELVEKAVNFAKAKLKLTHVLNEDLEGAAYPSGFFDVVHISEVLEHVPDPLALLIECRRILKPGGLFFLSLPNGVADRQGMIDYWKLYKKPPGHASGHIFFFSAPGLRLLLRSAGFEVQESHTYAFKQGLRSMRLFPKRKKWEGMFESRVEPELPSELEIELPHQKHSDFFYRMKYGLRERIRVRGMRRFGLGWHLVLRID